MNKLIYSIESMKQKLKQEYVIQKFIKINGRKYDYSKFIYNGATSNGIIICPIHGEFLKTPHDHYKKSGCKLCGIIVRSKKRLKTTEEFIKCAMKIHGNKYDYTLSHYVNSHFKIKIICPIHGEFLQKPYGHLNKQGCYKCGVERNKKRNTSDVEIFIEKSKLIHENLYDYSKFIYKNNHTGGIIICKIHGEFLQKPNHHLNGSGCPLCRHSISKPEMEFLDYLGIIHRNITLKNWKKKKVDGYDDKTNTIYEFLGDFWHGNPKTKFVGNKINPFCKKTYNELYEKTFYMFNKLKLLGYNVKYIWEHDWKNFKNGVDKIPNIIEFS